MTETQNRQLNEMGLESIWTVERKPGKCVKLYMKNKQQDFTKEITEPGKYSLAIHTPDFLPGGEAGRKVECLVTVFANLKTPPPIHLKEGENPKSLHDYLRITKDVHEKNIKVRDIYEVHSKQNTTVVEFEFKEEDLPGCVHIIAKTLTPLIGMRFTAKLFKNANFESIPETTYGPESEYMFRTLTISSIEEQLERNSEEKQKAYELGLIRPFLYLVSMHPIMRIQIGDLLGIKLIDLEENEKWSHDPHAQALMLLDKHLKGLGSISDHSWETGNPGSQKSNWYQCLYRGATEVHPTDHGSIGDGKKTTKDSMDHCKRLDDPTISELEMDFLEGAREIHLKEIEKLEGESKILTHMIDDHEKHPDVQQLYALFKKHGVDREILVRFLIEISVTAEYRNWLQHKEFEEKDKKKKEKSKDSKEENIKAWKKEKDNMTERLKPDDSYGETNDVIAGLRSQLLRGYYDPRGLGEAGKAAAKKLGQIVAKYIFKYFVLMPFFPFLVLPWDVYGLVDKVIGSDHQTVWLASLQLCLQRLLLAAHDLDIERYYPTKQFD